MTFFFTIIFVVLVFWRPQEWLVPQLYGWPVLDSVVIMSLLALLMDIDQRRIRFPKEWPLPSLLLGLFFATIMSQVAHTYFAGLMATVPEVFKICFFTLLFFCAMDSPRKLRMAIAVFVAMACFMAIHALLQTRPPYCGFGGQYALYIPAYGNSPAHLRSVFFGIFSDPNDLAQLMVSAMPFCLTLTRRPSVVSFLAGCGLIALLCQGVFATHSRGGLVALAGSAAVMVVLRLPARWLPMAMGALLIGALLLCPFSAAHLDVSAHDRVVFWGMANDWFKRAPLFGIGYGMFWQVAKDRAAHNAFVDCYTTIGLFGYWFWFNLLMCGFLGTWRARVRVSEVAETDRDGDWLRRVAGMAIASLLGFSASSYFLSRSFVYPLFLLFAILAAIPRIVSEHVAEENVAPELLLNFRRDVLKWGSFAALGSLFYIYVSILFLNRAFYG